MSSPQGPSALSPAQWLRQGQDAEARGDLTEAIRCYSQVAALLNSEPMAATRRELGIASMNRGNALQKLGTSQSIAEAVRAYDEAIALLGESADTSAFGAAEANALGAAWMNRGHAWQRLGTPEALAEAVRSYDFAVSLLNRLPLDDNRSYRINLAAAAMNRANALLAFPQPKAEIARESAAVALTVSVGAERQDTLVAEISLKARHALCASLAHLLARASTSSDTTALVTETGDTTDEALALVRHWEQRGVRDFRPLAVALYRFGAQFYLTHQPRFLAEFLLETLDPARSPGAIPEQPELHAIAAETIARGLADAYNHSLALSNRAETEALLRLRQDLTAAESRRASLAPATKQEVYFTRGNEVHKAGL